MDLETELNPLRGNPRKYLLLRIVGVSKKVSLETVKCLQITYDTWCRSPEFLARQNRMREFATDYMEEAILLLRKTNKVASIILEGKMIERMSAEVEAGVFVFMKTNVAKEVYSNLAGTMATEAPKQLNDWRDRVHLLTQNNFYGNEPPAPQITQSLLTVPKLHADDLTEPDIITIEGEELFDTDELIPQSEDLDETHDDVGEEITRPIEVTVNGDADGQLQEILVTS